MTIILMMGIMMVAMLDMARDNTDDDDDLRDDDDVAVTACVTVHVMACNSV